MLKGTLIALFLLAPTFAMAQQSQADPAFMQRAIVALQAQRNQALDAQTVAEAKLQGLVEELSKAQTKIKQLEDEVAKKSETVKK